MPNSNNNPRDGSIHNCCPYICCIPDRDGLLITAHFFTIVGVILLWSSFLGGTIVAMIGWIVLLCSSCGHTSRFGIIASGVFLLLAAIASCIQGMAAIIGDLHKEDAKFLKNPTQRRDNSDASSSRSTSEHNNYDMVCHLLAGFTLVASGVLLAASVLVFILICPGRLISHSAVSSSQQDEQPIALGPIIIIELKPEDKDNNFVTGQQNAETSEEEEVEIEDKDNNFVTRQQNVETSEEEEVEIEGKKSNFVTGQQNAETSEEEEEEIDMTKDQEHFLEGVV